MLIPEGGQKKLGKIIVLRDVRGQIQGAAGVPGIHWISQQSNYTRVVYFDAFLAIVREKTEPCNTQTLCR